ncbi:hypothetical protein CERSUDRAFT_117910 [Gelatoporia subvermispora B]|uniref:Uncharacterized protein n=1 Tax=Ceriporiopsis subvermispora (strain B) TaxID=914234 RepID=M2QM84_CERS8|nr:hypothetical protein CERSUDRAFT_117910 [Gelatoporia subvermispora B]
MPKTRRVLDSSPMEVPAARPTKPAPKSAVKRIAPQASLLTPPRTVQKRKRGKTPRSRRHDSDSDEREEDAGREDVGGYESERRTDGAVVVGNKKRKTLDAIAEELSGATAAEDAFWMGASDADGAQKDKAGPSKEVIGVPVKPEDERASRARTRSLSRTRSPSSSPPPAPHLLLRGHTGLISPPPSRRQPCVAPRPATPPLNLRRSPRRARHAPVRDSPDNPFLVSGSPGSVASATPQTPEPRTPVQHVERPTITYVFRGVKAVLPNPLYRPPGASPDEFERRSRLPLDHPDYSPGPACPPKLLFPEARRRDNAYRQTRSQVSPALPETPTRPTHSQTQAGKRARSAPENSAWDSSDEEAEPVPVPQPHRATKSEEPLGEDALQAAMAERVAKRLAMAAERARPELPRTRSRAHAADRPPDKDRSDVLRRAVGRA